MIKHTLARIQGGSHTLMSADTNRSEPADQQDTYSATSFLVSGASQYVLARVDSCDSMATTSQTFSIRVANGNHLDMDH